MLNDKASRYVCLRERIKMGASGNAPTMPALNEVTTSDRTRLASAHP
jgi:hypothetical protein